MKPTVFHPAAEAELGEVSGYYERLRRGLGSEFEASVEEAVQRLSLHPAACPLHGTEGMRKCFVRRFPFTLYFLEQPDAIWIAAVAHQRRAPEYWSGREP